MLVVDIESCNQRLYYMPNILNTFVIIKTFVRSYVYVISFEGNIYRQSSFIACCLMGEKEDKLEIQHGERRDFDEDTCLSSW